jgi:prolyl-tRNA editing enzyme YbaK/EbsC (Cys-tRNA(Pro) deacylase)
MSVTDSPHAHLTTQPAAERADLLAAPVAEALAADGPFARAGEVRVFPIDPALADTAALCAALGLPLATAANCVVVAGTRAGVTRYAACMALATTRVDVNGLVRRRLDARKASFAPMDVAVAATGMEYGGITPIGLPPDWALWVDAAVAATPEVIIGSGVRRSKLVLPGAALAQLPGAEVVEGLAC